MGKPAVWGGELKNINSIIVASPLPAIPCSRRPRAAGKSSTRGGGGCGAIGGVPSSRRDTSGRAIARASGGAGGAPISVRGSVHGSCGGVRRGMGELVRVWGGVGGSFGRRGGRESFLWSLGYDYAVLRGRWWGYRWAGIERVVELMAEMRCHPASEPSRTASWKRVYVV